MMIKKNYLFLIAFAIAMFSIITFSSAANSPMFATPNTTFYNRTSGTLLLNVTLDTNSININNVSFYRRANSHTGAWTYIGSVYNNTVNQTANYSLAFDTTSIVDDFNHEFNVTVANDSAIVGTSLASNITIDNGVPTVAFSTASLATMENRQSSVPFTIAIDADSTIGVANCTIYFNSGVPSLTIIGSGNACSSSFTASNFSLGPGEYNYVIGARDGSNNETNSSSRIITITGASTGSSIGSGSGNVQAPPSTTTPTNNVATTTPGTSFNEKISSFFNKIGNFFRNLFKR